MTMDERIRFLLRAATRAEDEGNERVARNFRRMAEEARPADRDDGLPVGYAGFGGAPE